MSFYVLIQYVMPPPDDYHRPGLPILQVWGFHCLRIQLGLSRTLLSGETAAPRSTTGRCGCIAAMDRNFCLFHDTALLLPVCRFYTGADFVDGLHLYSGSSFAAVVCKLPQGTQGTLRGFGKFRTVIQSGVFPEEISGADVLGCRQVTVVNLTGFEGAETVVVHFTAVLNFQK